jgi:hypothetical protein
MTTTDPDSPAERIMIARKDFTQQISKKAALGGLRMNNYSNDAFPEVLRVTFLRAAAATPNYTFNQIRETIADQLSILTSPAGRTPP